MKNSPCVRGFAYLFCAFSALIGPLRADVVINEIMYHPAHAEQTVEPVGEEYIELLNTGVAPVSVSGWSFSNGITFAFPATTIPAGGFLVIAADPGTQK